MEGVLQALVVILLRNCVSHLKRGEGKKKRQTKTQPPNQKAKPQGSWANHQLYKPLGTRSQRPPYIICSYCINTLHKSYAVSKTQTHAYRARQRCSRRRAADTLLDFAGSSTSPFPALRGGGRRGARAPLVSLHFERVCHNFLGRQSSQGCKFPFPASK